MLKKSRKFQLARKFRMPFGGGPEEGVPDQGPRGGGEEARALPRPEPGELVGPQDTVTMPGLSG